MLERLVVADDLSGAAESAATFLLRTTRIQVHLASGESGAPDQTGAAPRIVVLDSDTRHAPAAAAGESVARYAASALGASRGTRVVKKVDSLLRGNLASEVRALATLLDATVVIATALPSARRTVVRGVPIVDGRPLADTDLWKAEEGAVPQTVGDVLAGLAHVSVPLDVVRDPVGLRAALAAAEVQAVAAVCDAETEADLDAVVAASSGLRNPLLVGSAALVAAEARLLASDLGDAPETDRATTHVVAAVVGTAAPGIAEQVGQLADLGLPVLTLDPRELARVTRAGRRPGRAAHGRSRTGAGARPERLGGPGFGATAHRRAGRRRVARHRARHRPARDRRGDRPRSARLPRGAHAHAGVGPRLRRDVTHARRAGRDHQARQPRSVRVGAA